MNLYTLAVTFVKENYFLIIPAIALAILVHSFFKALWKNSQLDEDDEISTLQIMFACVCVVADIICMAYSKIPVSIMVTVAVFSLIAAFSILPTQEFASEKNQ